METRTITVISVVVAVLVFWAVGAYNRLIRLKNTIANAFGQIDLQQKRRCELTAKLVEAAEKQLSNERKTLDAVMTACNQARSASDAARVNPTVAATVTALSEAGQTLGTKLNQLWGLVNACEALEGDQAIFKLGEELTSTEHQVAFASRAFNDAVLDYNHAQGQFPAALIARLFGLVPSAVLTTAQNAAEQSVVSVGP